MCKFSKKISQDPVIKTEISQMRKKHEALLNELSLSCKNKSEGYFGPDSMTWKLYREPSIVLGSMRALLLQIAHPSIAKGVSMFSNYKKDTIGRSHRTFLSMTKIWFGDISTANNSARRLYNIHSMIRGQTVWETEDDNFFNPFCAADPALLFWVLATIIDTTLLFFEKTVRKLSQEEQEQFFQESKITAQLMGIPLSKYPKNLKDFYSRYNKIIKDGTLTLQEEGRKIEEVLFSTPYPIRRINEILAEGFMPNPVKKLYSFKSSRSVLNAILKISKVINFLTPNDLRYAPHYHQAKFRIALSARRAPRLVERVHYWMSTHINWYFISNKLSPRKV